MSNLTELANALADYDAHMARTGYLTTTGVAVLADAARRVSNALFNEAIERGAVAAYREMFVGPPLPEQSEIEQTLFRRVALAVVVSVLGLESPEVPT